MDQLSNIYNVIAKTLPTIEGFVLRALLILNELPDAQLNTKATVCIPYVHIDFIKIEMIKTLSLVILFSLSHHRTAQL